MQTFEITTEFIELCALLKLTGPCATGGIAKQLIINGNVTVDGQVEFRKKCKIRPGQIVTCGDHVLQITTTGAPEK